MAWHDVAPAHSFEPDALKVGEVRIQACFDIRTGKALDEPAEADVETYSTRALDGVVQFDLG